MNRKEFHLTPTPLLRGEGKQAPKFVRFMGAMRLCGPGRADDSVRLAVCIQ